MSTLVARITTAGLLAAAGIMATLGAVNTAPAIADGPAVTGTHLAVHAATTAVPEDDQWG
ncbi:hypothetical protein [Streptomyces sp. NPDC001480]|uniref:hypothetical protein n=1 Tax=Streptomyces sp. NPDC001480 TaxID=3364577 RepID=UPI0036964320